MVHIYEDYTIVFADTIRHTRVTYLYPLRTVAMTSSSSLSHNVRCAAVGNISTLPNSCSCLHYGTVNNVFVRNQYS